MKFTGIPLRPFLLFAALTLAVTQAAGQTDYSSSREHCETLCTVNLQSCQSDVSDEIDECEASCDKSSCSRCQEVMETQALEQCDSECDTCRRQCSASSESHRVACDTAEQQCLGKCMETP